MIPIQTKLPPLDEEGRLVLKLKGVFKVRTKILHLRGVNDYLIKWMNLQEDKATSEKEELIRSIHSS